MNQERRHRRTTTAGTVTIKEIGGILRIAMARDPEKGEDVWVLPKGHVRTGETLYDTALRETIEEVGTQSVQLIHYLGSVTRLSIEDWGETVEKDIHLYLAYAFGSTDIRPADFETVVESSWFTLEEALSRIPWQEDREFVHHHLKPMMTNPLTTTLTHGTTQNSGPSDTVRSDEE